MNALLMLAAAPDVMTMLIFAGVALAVIFCAAIVLLAYNVFGLWFQAMMSGAHIGIAELIAMRFRKVDVRRIVMNRIRLVKAAVEGSTKELESHMLSGGDVDRVTLALIAADRAGIELDFKKAAAIDLAGRDVLDAVQTSVLPKVIDVPAVASGRTTIDAVAGNAEIVLDGGVRRGSDIVKALALGANAVALGRAYLYGLGAGGERGVRRALEIMDSELRRTMALCGRSRLSALTRDLIFKRTLP